MNDKTLPLGYIGGDIMTHGSQLARQEECDIIDEQNLKVTYYSPAQNKSINDKSHMTEEENNHLAEKIVAADVDRLWNSDFTVMCPEQSAIGTMCETGILYAWKYMAEKLIEVITNGTTEEVLAILSKQLNRKNFFHYSDIRTNHLNEKDWRRSFSINQFLYGCILAAATDGVLHDNYEEILPLLKQEYGTMEDEA